MVQFLVHKMDCGPGKANAGVRGLLLRIKPWKGRQQGRMNIQNALRIGLHKGFPDQAHVSGQADHLHSGLLQVVHNGGIMLFPGGIVPMVEHPGGNVMRPGPFQAAGPGIIGYHQPDARLEQSFLNMVDDGLQVAAAA